MLQVVEQTWLRSLEYAF